MDKFQKEVQKGIKRCPVKRPLVISINFNDSRSMKIVGAVFN
jgi:hypothetical protein